MIAFARRRAGRTETAFAHLLWRLLSLTITAIAAPLAMAQTDFALADAAARAAVARGEIPSIAYAISRDGRVLHAQAFGYADVERHVSATLHTAYPLASLTKPITATALLVLHERSGISFDKPISEALTFLAPETPAQNPLGQVTLARLLHHTAGLGTYARIYFGEGIKEIPPFPASLREYCLPVQTPGLAAEYSNLGYGLLGEVIAERSGMSFADYLHRNVFGPLRMRDAFIADRHELRGARGYDADLKPLPQLWNDTPGAGDSYASVDDLLRFGWFHLAPESMPAMRLSAQSVAAMRERDHDHASHPMYGANTWYGQGWYVRGNPDTPVMIWHEGGMPGASTLLALYPGRDLVVTVLVNRSDAQALVQSLATQLVSQVDQNAPSLALNPVAGFAPLASESAFTGHWRGTIRVDEEQRAAAIDIDAEGNGRLSYSATPPAQITREFHAMTSGDSLISAVQGPWQSKDAPDGASALLLKLVRTADDKLQGALVAYEGPQRLKFLLPYSISLQRVGRTP